MGAFLMRNCLFTCPTAERSFSERFQLQFMQFGDSAGEIACWASSLARVLSNHKMCAEYSPYLPLPWQG